MRKCSYIILDNCYLITPQHIEFDQSTLYLIKGIKISHDSAFSSSYFKAHHLLNLIKAVKISYLNFRYHKFIKVKVISIDKKVSEDIVQLFKESCSFWKLKIQALK